MKVNVIMLTFIYFIHTQIFLLLKIRYNCCQKKCYRIIPIDIQSDPEVD